MINKYDIAKNPKDQQWHVIGYCGRNNQGKEQWIPVSGPYSNRQDAIDFMRKQYYVDKAAKFELEGI